MPPCKLGWTPRDNRERFASLQVSNRARDRPEDAGLAAARDFSGIGSVLKQASQAGGISGEHGHGLAGHPEDPAIDERRPGRDRDIIDEKLRGRAVGPIDDEIEALDDITGVIGIEGDRELLDFQPAVDIVQMARGGLDLGAGRYRRRYR